ncbi:MAG: carbohydrate ABC transporter permease [Chloroflexi bacterium]|nr:carbohydrate ABC transporter permease [Chloroflexota bacterium]
MSVQHSEDDALVTPRRRRPGPQRLVLYALLAVALVVALFPGYWMLVTALTQEGKEFSYPPAIWPEPLAWENFRIALTEWPFDTYFLNSFMIAGLGTIGALLTEAMAGYAFARLRFPGRDLWFSICLATLMLPFVVTMIPRFVIFSQLGLVDTIWPLVIPYWFGGSAFGVFLFRQFFRTIPFDLDEAATLDGASHARIWWSIVLPQSRAIFVTLALLHFVWFWNDFMGPLIYLHSDDVKTLPLGLLNFKGQYTQDWNLMMASALAMTLPILVLILLGQRYFQKGMAFTGMGGR